VQEFCQFATRHSLLAAVLTFASRYSLPFPDLPICRPHDLPTTWLSRNFALPFFSGYATFENLPKFLPAEGGEGDAL
jgi:hypothetical protein